MAQRTAREEAPWVVTHTGPAFRDLRGLGGVGRHVREQRERMGSPSQPSKWARMAGVAPEQEGG